MVVLEEELQIEETEPLDDEETQNIRYEITSFPTDFTVEVMYEKWKSGQLVIPDFQRSYVWHLPQASRLIESFLLGLPIPQVFLYRERSNPQLVVIDGHQRLETIAKFYSGQFSKDRVFRLRGISSTWEGKGYSDLSPEDKLNLDDSTLRSIIIQQVQPNNNSSVYEIFERLNVGGTQLNPMEIRRAIFHKQASQFLETLNTNNDWRALIGMQKLDPRYRDVELVLRVLALAENVSAYAKPMKKFITDYMEVLDGLSTEETQLIEQSFAIACGEIHEQLGPRPFHLHQRLNVAALDSVLASWIVDIGSITTEASKAYEELKQDSNFLDTVQQDTSDVAIVQKRFELVRSAIVS